MKKLSDYKDDEALDLWGDLLEPLSEILTDEGVRSVIKSGKPRLITAKEILKSHKKETVEILKRIDPEEINGLNIILRLMNLLAEIGQNEEIKSFFAYAEQEKTDNESFGSPMESIEAEEK